MEVHSYPSSLLCRPAGPLHACVALAWLRVSLCVLTLVDGGVGGEEVEVLLAVHVPHVRAQTALQHHRQRGVVVRANAILELNRGT